MFKKLPQKGKARGRVAMLYGAPAATLDVLQRAQNNLARVVSSASGEVEPTPDHSSGRSTGCQSSIE